MKPIATSLYYLYFLSGPSPCAESLVRTRSRGYVAVTEVMPARPPATSRFRGDCSLTSSGIPSNWGTKEERRERKIR